MRTKKLLSLFLMILLLLNSLSAASLAADRLTRLTVDEVSAKPGETVIVSICLTDNPGIVSANINVAFDEGLTLVGAANGITFPKSMSFIPPKQLSAVGKITGSCNFAWQGVDIADKDIKDGVILTLYFKVSENACSGDVYGISVASRSSDVVDKNLQCITLSPSYGEVNVSGNVPDSDSDNTLSNFIKSYTNFIRRIFLMIRQLLSIQAK